jgi:hypothetical protein
MIPTEDLGAALDGASLDQSVRPRRTSSSSGGALEMRIDNINHAEPEDKPDSVPLLGRRVVRVWGTRCLLFMCGLLAIIVLGMLHQAFGVLFDDPYQYRKYRPGRRGRRGSYRSTGLRDFGPTPVADHDERH